MELNAELRERLRREYPNGGPWAGCYCKCDASRFQIFDVIKSVDFPANSKVFCHLVFERCGEQYLPCGLVCIEEERMLHLSLDCWPKSAIRLDIYLSTLV